MPRTPCRDWILVTGQPGCGKTTAVQRLVQKLQDAGLPVQGFVTQEVRRHCNNGSTTTRSGFDIVTLPHHQRGRLARKDGMPSSWPSTGAYRVDVASIDRIAVPTLSLDSTTTASSRYYPTILVLDEIGRMELHSKAFQQAVERLLQYKDGPVLRLVGAVTAPRYGHRVPFCDHVTAHDGVQVHNLTKATRNDIVDDLMAYMETHWMGDTADSSSPSVVLPPATKKARSR